MIIKPLKPAFYTFAAIAIPFVVAWAYLYISRSNNLWTESSDYIALAVGVTNALGAILLMSAERSMKVVLALLYVPIITPLLIFFSLIYVCLTFDACL